MKKTLEYYIQKKYMNHDSRFMPDDIKEELNRKTPHCTGSIKEKLHWLKNNITDYPPCKVCGKKLSSKSFILNGPPGYRRFCSVSCSRKDDDVKKKLVQTSLERYGTDHPLKSQQIQSKRKATNVKRYGSEHPHPWESEKFKASMLKKYGVLSSSQIPDIKRDKQAGLIYDYIVSGKLREKIIQLEIKHNVKCLNPELVLSLDRVDTLKKLESVELSWQHLECDEIYKSSICDGHISPCRRCNHGGSVLERQLIAELNSMLKPGELIIYHDRNILNGFELDIFLPDRKVAIEMNGLYWHCSENKDRNYHLKKTEACEKNGIQLIHIFEQEWIFKREIVLSRIKAIIGSIETRKYARNLNIRELTKIEKSIFLNANHLQGNDNSSVALGLLDDQDYIFSVMTFGKPRFDKKARWELIRFCSELNLIVIGGANKLFKHFVTHYMKEGEDCISYADRRWSVGDLYQKLNYKKISNTPPSYIYASVDSPKVYTRYQAQKKRLKGLLGNHFEERLSEEENMRRANWFKIYDSGSIKFAYTKIL